MSRILVPLLLAVALACGGAALARAASLEDLLAGQLVASAAPALLEPITSAGRKGWDCQPEHAAAAPLWHAAGLPADPETP
jgi:hypothetical protein